MSRKTIFVLFLLFTALALTSCDVTCDSGSLVQPDLVSPDWREVVDGSATVLEWSYPDTCEPEEFEIILSKDRDYAVIEHTQLVPGDSTTWIPSTLDIAEEYWWRVRAKVGSSYGGYSGQRRSFFTLPYCTSGDLYMTSAVYPPYGGIFTRGYDSLEWEWPISSCIPESYRVELSTDSGFVDTSLNGGTGSPSTRWGPGSPLDPATQYFWRITPFADGVWGPTSNAYSFFTDPICSGASLVAPNAVTPLNGDTSATANPIFEWSYSPTGCSPEGTHFQIATSPDFSTIFINADNPTHASRSAFFGVPLDDCTIYYWRVAMVSEGIQGPYSFPQAFTVDETDSCTCDAVSLPIPELIWPEPVWTGNYDIVSLTPTLEWNNPGPCTPDGYQVKLADLPDHADPSLDGVVMDGLITSYTPSVMLQPARQYWWHVYSTFGGSLSNNSNYAAFFTEPECGSASDLMPPDLILPVNGASIDTLRPMLHYEQPLTGCIPDSYLINIQTAADFSGQNLLGQIAFPSTAAGPGQDLADCTMYYWKVNGVQSGADGPESSVNSFFVDTTGTCLPPGVPGTAKSNNFCREGTFELFDALATVEVGDRVLAIARNPFTTYLKLTILDQETKEPFKHEIRCWSYIGNYEPGWLETPEYMQYSFEDLPVEIPPPTPVPTEIPTCNKDLEVEDCKASGGTYDSDNHYCNCSPSS